jgi:hypothetical protein
MKTYRARLIALAATAAALVLGSQSLPAFGADAAPPSANQTPGVAAPLPDPYARVERAVADSTINDSLEYTPVAPCRVANTRIIPAGPIGNNATRNFGMYGGDSFLTNQGGNQCNIPSYVRAVHVNVTAIAVTGGAGPGYLTVFPFGTTQPDASVMNFLAGQTVANAFTVPTGNSFFDLSVFNAFGTTHVLIDILGYYSSPFVAEVNADGTLSRGTNGISTSKLSTGGYQVNVPRNVTDCASMVTLGTSESGPSIGQSYSENRFGVTTAKFVATRDSTGVAADRAFTIRLMC